MKIYSNMYEAVQASDGTLLFRKGIIKKAESHLFDSERIYFSGLVTFRENLMGVLTITNNRVYGYASVLGDSYYQEIPITDIRNVSFSKLDKSLHINGSLCTIDGIVVSRTSLSTIQDTIHELQNMSINEKPNSVSPRVDIQALKDLKELLDNDIITTDEFEAKKKQILGL